MERSISRRSPTVCAPSASRASRSTLPTGIFSTTRRSFILADTPGHERYTRNMFTGASTADVALVLIDARSGVVTQTRRHAHIAALLGIEHIVMCVNKMDLVGWDRAAVPRRSPNRSTTWSGDSDVPDLTVIPISALHGDNVALALRPHAVLRRPDAARVSRGGRRPGRPRPVAAAPPDPVGRAAAWTADRGCTWGRIVAGTLEVGDEVVVLPAGVSTTITELDTLDGDAQAAVPPMSVTFGARRPARRRPRRRAGRARTISRRAPASSTARSAG